MLTTKGAIDITFNDTSPCSHHTADYRISNGFK